MTALPMLAQLFNRGLRPERSLAVTTTISSTSLTRPHLQQHRPPTDTP